MADATIKLHYPFAICAISLLLCLLVYVIGMPFRRKRRRR
jgi:hypothetical protein